MIRVAVHDTLCTSPLALIHATCCITMAGDLETDTAVGIDPGLGNGRRASRAGIRWVDGVSLGVRELEAWGVLNVCLAWGTGGQGR